MTWIGIDPGKSGAIAILYPSRGVMTMRLDATEADIWQWLQTVTLGDAFAMLEKVGAMPKQGVSSTFKFGQSYGMCRTLLIAAGIPFETVAPGVWQRSLGCLTKGDKNVTKSKAQEMFPSQRIIHATADAILLAEYCRRRRGGTM